MEAKEKKLEMRQRLKEFRKELGLKQREIAERLGINVGVVGGWECGRDPIPDARIYQLCNEYNVNEEWLRTGKGTMFNPIPSAQDAYVTAFAAIYDRLPQDLQDVFRRVAKEHLGLKTEKHGEE